MELSIGRAETEKLCWLVNVEKMRMGIMGRDERKRHQGESSRISHLEKKRVMVVGLKAKERVSSIKLGYSNKERASQRSLIPSPPSASRHHSQRKARRYID